jgi:hypothetical protein
MESTCGDELITDILRQEQLRETLELVIHQVLGAMDNSSNATQEVKNMLFNHDLNGNVLKLEKLVHAKLIDCGLDETKMLLGMRERAEIIFSEIEKYLTGDSLADVGCGHGLVGWLSSSKFKDVKLFDLVDYHHPKVTFPVITYPESQDIPFETSFDCTLLITVLHHSEKPLRLLNHVWKNTNKRLIVIESVYGVSSGEKESPLHKFNETDQRSYAIFCDWFYNRVLNQDVPVPYNFQTPEKWCELFQSLEKANLLCTIDLGVDIQIVPEHHFLFVLDKEQSIGSIPLFI